MAICSLSPFWTMLLFETNHSLLSPFPLALLPVLLPLCPPAQNLGKWEKKLFLALAGL